MCWGLGVGGWEGFFVCAYSTSQRVGLAHGHFSDLAFSGSRRRVQLIFATFVQVFLFFAEALSLWNHGGKAAGHMPRIRLFCLFSFLFVLFFVCLFVSLLNYTTA